MTNQIIKSAKKLNVESKIRGIQSIIQRTILSSQRYKLYDILGANELNICVSTLNNIFEESNNILDEIKNKTINDDILSTRVAYIEQELVTIIKNFGTESIKDLIYIILGSDYIINQFNTDELINKFDIINQCSHPINFKSMLWKNETDDIKKKQLHKNRIIEDYMITEQANNLECFDLARTSKSFQTKVYGIKICLHDHKLKKTYTNVIINPTDTMEVNILPRNERVPFSSSFSNSSFFLE